MALFGKPRLLQLGEIAARAETLRWQRVVRGYRLRAAYGAIAAVFAVMAVVSLHIGLWAGLARSLGPTGAAITVALVDLLACLVLGWLAVRRRIDSMAQQARAVRDTALLGARTEVRTLGGWRRNPTQHPMRKTRRVSVSPPLG